MARPRYGPPAHALCTRRSTPDESQGGGQLYKEISDREHLVDRFIDLGKCNWSPTAARSAVDVYRLDDEGYSASGGPVAARRW
jgi:hypothetical protein